MRKLIKIACWITVIISLLALAERQVFGSWDHVMRYRFTIEIDDNGQIRRGTTVQELHCWFNDGMFRGLGNALTCWTKGGALVIDMGKKGYLFALLTNDVNHRDTTELPSDAFINAILGKYQDLTAYSFLETSLHFGQNVAIKWN